MSPQTVTQQKFYLAYLALSGMARSAVIGATTRRVLLAYRRTLGNPSNDSPLFLS